MHLLIDGVAFQRDTPSTAHWRCLLEQLALQPELAITLLDRGSAPAVRGVQRLPFPEFRGRDAAADSLLIQQMCDQFNADIFISTGSTSPVATPTLAVLPMGRDRADEQESATGLAFAQHYVCTNEQARTELIAAFPGLPTHRIASSTAEPAALAAAIQRVAHQLLNETRAGSYDEFFKEWTRIRRMHAAVDWAAA